MGSSLRASVTTHHRLLYDRLPLVMTVPFSVNAPERTKTASNLYGAFVRKPDHQELHRHSGPLLDRRVAALHLTDRLAAHADGVRKLLLAHPQRLTHRPKLIALHRCSLPPIKTLSAPRWLDRGAGLLGLDCELNGHFPNPKPDREVHAHFPFGFAGGLGHHTFAVRPDCFGTSRYIRQRKCNVTCHYLHNCPAVPNHPMCQIGLTGASAF